MSNERTRSKRRTRSQRKQPQKRPRGNEQTEATLAQRFWSKVVKSKHPDGCWVWTGARGSKGYGSLARGERGLTRLTHRISWEMHHGPIPDGMCVCHHCDSPPCIRPDHLFLGTDSDNMRDMNAKGRRGVYGRARVRNYDRRLTAEELAIALGEEPPPRPPPCAGFDGRECVRRPPASRRGGSLGPWRCRSHAAMHAAAERRARRPQSEDVLAGLPVCSAPGGEA